MLVSQNRPRNLSWFHTGPLLFGDWGTSRLYVLGLAFFFVAHASFYYIMAMGVIMAGVAWAYTIVCREFPDGGGVYSSAQKISRLLAVMGATLLLCDYIVTASLSTVEAFHYFGVHEHWAMPLSIVAIFVLGIINWYGSDNAGRFAFGIAIAAMGASLVLGLMCIPFMLNGLKNISWHDVAKNSHWERWTSLVQIMLALSGVEAVSNMTGMMKEPVAKTAKRTIWPVLAEVVVLNLVFILALSGLSQLQDIHTPDFVKYGDGAVPGAVHDYRDTALRVLGVEAGRHWFGVGNGVVFGNLVSIVFGLLLLSASNTVIVGMISVLYALSRDKEVPHGFSKLNYAGVPWWGLVFAVAAPCVVLLFVSDVQLLADLYAVGVVGAICINVFCCVVNKHIHVKKWERAGLLVVGLVMLATELTIIATKHHAAYFAGGMVAAVLAIRWGLHRYARRGGEPLQEPSAGWLGMLRSLTDKPGPGPRIMVAARGRDNAEFAVDLARRRKAALFGLFIRRLQVVDVTPENIPKVDDDAEAQESLGTIALLAQQAGVPFFPIYVTSSDIANEILDYTVTFGCDTLIMGKSKRAAVSRALGGDVLAQVATHLPEGISLITRASGAPPQQPPAGGEPAPAPAPAPSDEDEVASPS
ncbi:MAG: amino acid permease [Tepidisphaera sp.]|nr:amino acid permease [Tepidisphaera sp.]